MAIELSNPIVIPETVIEEKTFNEIWLSKFIILANNPNERVSVMAEINRARTLPNGQKEFLPEGKIDYRCDDFFTATQQDPELLQIMGALINKLKTIVNL
jgi:hypothetical protein